MASVKILKDSMLITYNNCWGEREETTIGGMWRIISSSLHRIDITLRSCYTHTNLQLQLAIILSD